MIILLLVPDPTMFIFLPNYYKIKFNPQNQQKSLLPVFGTRVQKEYWEVQHKEAHCAFLSLFSPSFTFLWSSKLSKAKLPYSVYKLVIVAFPCLLFLLHPIPLPLPILLLLSSPSSFSSSSSSSSSSLPLFMWFLHKLN